MLEDPLQEMGMIAEQRRIVAHVDRLMAMVGKLETRLPAPRQGPIALGYAVHFGLGLFVPLT